MEALEVVSVELCVPEEPDDALVGAVLTAHNRMQASFKKANKVAKKLMVMTMKKKPLQLSLTLDTANAMWDKLLDIYKQNLATSIGADTVLPVRQRII